MSNDRAKDTHTAHLHLVLRQVNTDRNRRIANWIISSLLNVRISTVPDAECGVCCRELGNTKIHLRRLFGPQRTQTHTNNMSAITSYLMRCYTYITLTPSYVCRFIHEILHMVCVSSTCTNATHKAPRQIKCALTECTLQTLVCLLVNTFKHIFPYTYTHTCIYHIWTANILLHHRTVGQDRHGGCWFSAIASPISNDRGVLSLIRIAWYGESDWYENDLTLSYGMGGVWSSASVFGFVIKPQIVHQSTNCIKT